MFFKKRCIGFTFWRSKFLGFIRSTLASHICSTDSIPWVHHSREEGSLDYDGRLVRLQVYLKFNTIIHRQQQDHEKLVLFGQYFFYNILVGLNFPKELHIKPMTYTYTYTFIYICFERERSRINRLERQDEMRVYEQDARWFKFLNLV
jgi:hypothetical protein